MPDTERGGVNHDGREESVDICVKYLLILSYSIYYPKESSNYLKIYKYINMIVLYNILSLFDVTILQIYCTDLHY